MLCIGLYTRASEALGVDRQVAGLRSRIGSHRWLEESPFVIVGVSVDHNISVIRPTRLLHDVQECPDPRGRMLGDLV